MSATLITSTHTFEVVFIPKSYVIGGVAYETQKQAIERIQHFTEASYDNVAYFLNSLPVRNNDNPAHTWFVKPHRYNYYVKENNNTVVKACGTRQDFWYEMSSNFVPQAGKILEILEDIARRENNG